MSDIGLSKSSRKAGTRSESKGIQLNGSTALHTSLDSFQCFP